jgi:hypothetical protein
VEMIAKSQVVPATWIFLVESNFPRQISSTCALTVY